METLPKNWNGSGAEPFRRELTGKIRALLPQLVHQPEIYPLADFGVQLEYHSPDHSYLEIDLSLEENAEVFQQDADGSEKNAAVRTDAESINRLVEDFYSHPFGTAPRMEQKAEN